MTKEKFIPILLRQRCSSLSVSDFCSNEGYSRTQFYVWRSKFAISDDELSSASEKYGVVPEFQPIIIKHNDLPVTSTCNIPSPVNVIDNSEISLELPNGLKLNFKGEYGRKQGLELILKLYKTNVQPK